MDKEGALDSIKANVENENLIKHMLATEAIMRSLARRLGEEEEEWGVANLRGDNHDRTESHSNRHLFRLRSRAAPTSGETGA